MSFAGASTGLSAVGTVVSFAGVSTGFSAVGTVVSFTGITGTATLSVTGSTDFSAPDVVALSTTVDDTLG